MDEVEELRRRRLAELRAQQEAGAASGQPTPEEVAAQEEAMFEQLVARLMEPEARERITRIRLSRPDHAAMIVQQVAALARQGRLRNPLSDNELKALLQRVQPEDRDIHITRR